MREKAPGSGGPAAGKPEGVKSGEKLFEQVKASVHNSAPPENVDVAPAEQAIRETNPDGSANPDKEREAGPEGAIAEAEAEAEAEVAAETATETKKAARTSKKKS